MNKDLNLILNLYYEPPQPLKDYLSFNNDIYVPINCGNLDKSSKFARSHVLFEDELPDNIANLNPRLNEMTAIWAIWKNNVTASRYIGFQHYRRFFHLDDLEDLDDYDIMDAFPIPMTFNMSHFTGEEVPHFVDTTIENGYAICHFKEDWDKMEDELRNDKAFHPFVQEWKGQNMLTSPCNLFIFRRGMFEEYCEWIFPILFRLNERIDLTGRDAYQSRALAFLSERLTSLFIYAKRQMGYRVKTANPMFFNEWKPNDAPDKLCGGSI